MTTEEYSQTKNVTDGIADISIIGDIISTLTENSIEYKLNNFDNNIFISVKGCGQIIGNRLPLHFESIFGGYNPELTQTDEFVELIDNINNELKFGTIHYEHIQDPDSDYDGTTGTAHLLNDLASLKDGGKFASFVETIIYYNSEISVPILGSSLMNLLQNRKTDMSIATERLKKYRFDDVSVELKNQTPTAQPAMTTKTDKDYFTFNVDSSALVVGQTGSGKTELVRQYIRRIENAYTPDQTKYIIFDLKQVEFDPAWEGGANTEYLYTYIRHGTPEDMDYLEEIAKIAESRSQEEKPTPFLFIYIEECDLAAQYPGRFHAAVIAINKLAAKANMKLIFSSSRTASDIIPADFRDSFDLILSGTLASTVDEATVGVPGATALPRHEFLVKENPGRANS